MVKDLGSQLRERTSLPVRQSVDDLLPVAVTRNVVNPDMLAKGAVYPEDNEALARLFLTMIETWPNLSYITWGQESGEYVQAFRDHGGRVSVEWHLETEDGGRDLVDFLPLADGTLRETQREPNTARALPSERPYTVAAREVGVVQVTDDL